jgi:hypothetical protein
LAHYLRDKEFARRTAWMHLPVRLAVHARAQQDAALKPFTVQGTIEYAALASTFDTVDEVREEERDSRERALFFMDIGALVLAPFTLGESLIAAGFVHAAVALSEINDAVRDYKGMSSLAAATLSEVEAALWTRPSTAGLVATIAEKSLDAASAVVTEGKLSYVIDLLQVGATVAAALGGTGQPAEAR